MRVGIGYDIHPLATGKKLILGGVQIPYSRGLYGHSDADVLSHSIGDALLGAMGEKDLGSHFPDEDPQYENICSLHLLERIREMLKERNFSIANVDSSIIAQEPKISPYLAEIKIRIAESLNLKPNQVGIKATSPEGIGFLGKKEGIACLAIVSISVNGLVR